MIQNIKTRILALAIAFLLSFAASAENVGEGNVFDKRLFNHLDASLTLGSGGVGLDLSLPATEWARVRAGFAFMPRFIVPMTFALSSYVEGEGVAPISSKIDKMQEIMTSFTGLTIDEKVDMNAHARMVDFKLLVDIYPFKNNRHWYATVGFYWGSSKIGHIENTIYEMPSLVGVMMYNSLYDYFESYRYWDEPLFDGFAIDPMRVGDKMREKFMSTGRVGAHLGDFKDTGSPYLMVPGEDGLLKADMYVNHFKPFVGVGYETAISSDKRWKVGVDLGVMFWGGAPRVVTHNNKNYMYLDHNWEGADYRVDLSNDVVGVKGKVGNYLDITSKFTAYPILNAKISFTIF